MQSNDIGERHGQRCAAGLALAMMLAVVWTPVFATELPPGFAESIVVEVPFPANFAQFSFAADGRLFVADKFGLVTVYAPDGAGGYVFEASAQLNVAADGERGINGLAADPDFTSNRHLWIYYSTPEPQRNLLSRFTYGNRVLKDETVVIEGPLVQNLDHNAGCIRFASDKTLFVAMGDDLQGSATAQDPFDLRGTILRIDRDGSPAAGNPFFDGTGGDPRVWAFGFRNPYRISVQPVTDNVFVADVGQATWDEVSLGIPGADFGWADVEGITPAAVPGVVYPIHAIAHPVGGAAIIGGDFAPSGFAPGYAGDYFYADFVQKTLWRMGLDDANTPAEVELWATDFGRATDIQFGPGDALYYVCRSCTPASVRKIEYVPGANSVPVARATAFPDNGPAPLEVVLDGSTSSDGDDDPLAYDWDLGDGSDSSIASPTRTYSAGVYLAQLTVNDGQGGADSTPPVRIVAGNSRPAATVITPPDESGYDAGDLILYSGSVTDPEDGQVSCSVVTWQVFEYHTAHSHPIRGPVQGTCVGAFAIPTDGESDPNQWYEIRISAFDSGAPLGPGAELLAQSSIEIRPNLVALTFESTPTPGLTVELDGEPLETPAVLQGLVNDSRTIGTFDPQLGADGLWYRFQGWSDGGGLVHGITTPPSDVTYTADFACAAPAIENLMINPGPGDEIVLTWDPALDGCIQSGSGRYRIYSSTAARPEAGEGDFPNDPMYRLVGSSAAEQFSYEPSPRDVYFLVVGAGPDGHDGVTGHYGF